MVAPLGISHLSQDQTYIVVVIAWCLRKAVRSENPTKNVTYIAFADAWPMQDVVSIKIPEKVDSSRSNWQLFRVSLADIFTKTFKHVRMNELNFSSTAWMMEVCTLECGEKKLWQRRRRE
ncbi:hypothetical protein Tco_0446690 [Tanacetum coccineum]